MNKHIRDDFLFDVSDYYENRLVQLEQQRDELLELLKDGPKFTPAYCKLVDETIARTESRIAVSTNSIPSVLFDGYAVMLALNEKAKARTNADNVRDVLDAIVKLMRDADK